MTTISIEAYEGMRLERDRLRRANIYLSLRVAELLDANSDLHRRLDNALSVRDAELEPVEA